MTRVAPLLVVLAGWPAAGCAPVSAPELPALAPQPVPELPDDFAESAAAGVHEPLTWWREFADPVLDEVVEKVLASNFDMAEAVARVQQARIRARMAEAAVLPTVRARAGVDQVDAPINAGVGAQLQELGLAELFENAAGGFTLPDRLGLTTYSLSADFAWEFDFWDRMRSASLAAGARLLAAEWDVDAVRIGVLAQTIAAYFDIVDFRRQIAIARDTVDVLREREQLAETRYERGLADSLDVHRLRQSLRNAEEGLSRLDDGLVAAEARLAVLLGGYREDLAAILPASLAPAPALDVPPAGVPADLLLQRPDVRAAGHRLEAAVHDVEVRRAELKPALSLSGSIGLQTTDVTGLFNVQQWFNNLISNLLVPVFDGGRLASNVALAHARFNELAAVYGRTVVTAVNEVETALAELRNAGRRHAFIAARREEAQATLDLRSERYASGLGGYGDYLDALRTLLNVESALASAERNLALARLAVHRALGGAWTAPDAAAAEALTAAARPAE